MSKDKCLKDIHSKGQYFTSNNFLRSEVFKLIKNKPQKILEPSVGRGDLIEYINERYTNLIYDCYEIDSKIDFLDVIGLDNVNISFCDFLTRKISEKYDTIVGNPPYVKTKNGNLYIDFIDKCVNLLNPNGELIFIVPSDFLKLTSSGKVINNMLQKGCITDIIHPHNETLFKNANIDIIVFRYCLNETLPKTTIYNGNIKQCINTNGIITFTDTKQENLEPLNKFFHIHVGQVSGNDKVYKNATLGNVELLTGENTLMKYILLDSFPTSNNEINEYMLKNKPDLISRKIRKFNEDNWYEWGALRNYETTKNMEGTDCIYVSNLTRNDSICFKDTVKLFAGNLIIMIPKTNINLDKVCSILNSDEFKKNYLYSGRFKIGQKQLANALIDPQEILT